MVYRAVVNHQTADEPSRLPSVEVYNSILQDETIVMVVARTKNHDQKKYAVSFWAQKKESPPTNKEGHHAELRTLSALVITQSKNMFCEQSPQMGGLPDSSFTFKKNGFFVRKALLMVQYKILCLRHRGHDYSNRPSFNISKTCWTTKDV